MGSEAKIYYMSDANLVMNTMIDALKYENRRVIDITDIECYKNNFLAKVHQENCNVIFYGTYRDQEEFDREIEDYAIRYENQYVLLPWIDQNDLIQSFRGTLPFAIFKVIARKNRDSFLSKRSCKDLEKFQNIESLVLEKTIISISNAYEKLKKIRKNQVEN